MSREVRLWEWLRDGSKHMRDLHMRRVENKVSEGDPDVDGCLAGDYFELELKGCPRPVRGGKLDFEVRQAQALWHRRRWRVGGNCWFFVRVGVGLDVARILVPGAHHAALKEGVTEHEMLALPGAILATTAEALLRTVADPATRLMAASSINAG